MATTLWELPVPSTALLDGGPVFEKRLRREIALRMSYESETDGATKSLALVFEGVEAFRVTYDRARADWMRGAYDRLVDEGKTAWLSDVSQSLDKHGGDSGGLVHLVVNFDDGPCYEVICHSHRFDA